MRCLGGPNIAKTLSTHTRLISMRGLGLVVGCAMPEIAQTLSTQTRLISVRGLRLELGAS